MAYANETPRKGEVIKAKAAEGGMSGAAANRALQVAVDAGQLYEHRRAGTKAKYYATVPQSQDEIEQIEAESARGSRKAK